MTTRVRSSVAALFVALASVALVSCRREAPSNVDRNRAPETYVTLAPAESLVTFYRAHLYWSGRDPDGQVAYYEIAVTDSNRTPEQDLDSGTGYTKTLKTDSTFVFRADPPTEQQLLGYRFFVRAVDNEGKFDPTPAVAYFVARNDNYPTVVFRPWGLATWKDRFGNTLTRVLGSTDPDSPTDTMGVEGCIAQSWTGFDADEGGFISGFEYKLQSQLNYGGGSLADTFATYCFPPLANRKQVLQVRAIDDGGLRSPFDFTRSVVVNFDPNTLIVHPSDRNPDGTPLRGRFFRIGTQIWRSGTTLADFQRDGLEYFFTGFDDERELQPTWDVDKGISQYEERSLYRVDSDEGFGGTAYEQLRFQAGAPAVYPLTNSVTHNSVGSGDNLYLLRSRDKQNVPDSTPDSVLISINYRPYIVQFTARPESEPASADVDLLNKAPGDVTVFRLLPGEKLLVTLRGSDVHRITPAVGSEPYLYDHNTVVENEDGIIEPLAGGYRVYLSNVVTPPGFDNPTTPPNFTAALDVDHFGQFLLIADVRDRTFTNVSRVGRKGTVARPVRLEERVP